MNYKKIKQDYLTIKEAAKLTGKSEITIRRLIKSEPYQDTMQDTMQNSIHQSKLSSLLIKKEKTQKGFIYKVQKQFILDKIKLKTKSSDKANDKADDKVVDKVSSDKLSDKISHEIILTLKEQLHIKDKQIENLSRKIDELIERDRETNIILKGLQDKFFLLEAPKKETPQNNAPRQKTKEKKKSFLNLLLGW